MIVLQIVFALFGAFAEPAEQQTEIDRAFALIFKTEIGRSVCQSILGGNAQAIERHLGVSREAAQALAQTCTGPYIASRFVYLTDPSDIAKLSRQGEHPRRYEVKPTAELGLLESWTDSYRNVTTILVPGEELRFNRLVQLLAHEMAVYFDSKANPAHPSAYRIPELHVPDLLYSGKLHPMVAVTNPLSAHSLTYLRALQVEFAIIEELVRHNHIAPPDDFSDITLRKLLSESCAHHCIEMLVQGLQQDFLPYALPLLAFSPYYRALMLAEVNTWGPEWQTADVQQALSRYPLDYLRRHVSEDAQEDMSHAFTAVSFEEKQQFADVTAFMQTRLWPVEWSVIASSRFATGETLLEYMKRPLLSGYNILVTSGPRVRVRSGIIE